MAGNYAKLPGLSNYSPEFIAYTNAPTILSQAGALFGAAAVVVLLRFYVRISILRSFGKDDWFMLLAFAFAIALFITYVEETKVGLGKHLAVIQANPISYLQFLRLRQVHGILITIGIALVKISIAFFLLRFVTLKRYRWFLHGLNIFMVLFTTACLGTLGTGNAKCFNSRTFTSIGLFNTSINAATDILLALLPVPLVWSLKLNLRARISLVLVLTLGLFAGIAGIVKSQKQKAALYNPDQYVYDSFTIWWIIEYNVGMIAASLPALKPLFRRALETARSTAATKNSGRQYPTGSGYHKHVERSDKDIMMDYVVEPSNSVKVTSDQTGKADDSIWRIGHMRDIEESSDSLPCKDTPNVIYVTTDVRVT